MTETDLLHEDDQTRAVAIAYHAAANCVSFFSGPQVNSLHWPLCGHEDADAEEHYDRDKQAVADTLADYVRTNKTAPAESLYRYAHGQGLHAAGVDNYEAADMPYRVAYQVFFTTLISVDAAIVDERERNRQREAASRGPVLAAALSERPEDTVLEQLPHPLAKVAYGRVVIVEGAVTTSESADAAPKDRRRKARA